MNNQVKISEAIFDMAVKHSRMKGKTLTAARESLVMGMSPIKAAAKYEISRQAVSACIKRVLANAFKFGACPCCGQIVQAKNE